MFEIGNMWRVFIIVHNELFAWFVISTVKSRSIVKQWAAHITKATQDWHVLRCARITPKLWTVKTIVFLFFLWRLRRCYGRGLEIRCKGSKGMSQEWQYDVAHCAILRRYVYLWCNRLRLVDSQGLSCGSVDNNLFGGFNLSLCASRIRGSDKGRIFCRICDE